MNKTPTPGGGENCSMRQLRRVTGSSPFYSQRMNGWPFTVADLVDQQFEMVWKRRSQIMLQDADDRS